MFRIFTVLAITIWWLPVLQRGAVDNYIFRRF